MDTKSLFFSLMLHNKIKKQTFERQFPFPLLSLEQVFSFVFQENPLKQEHLYVFGLQPKFGVIRQSLDAKHGASL